LHRGFPKTSVFGKATLDLWEKAGSRPLFWKLFTKLTEFWEKFHKVNYKIRRVRMYSALDYVVPDVFNSGGIV
ncbi:MAG: hypothetical protein LBP23_05295, partial [Treponema sp.]|nr:hypothetical protein [Treponema sp.]